jgi:hypothetical protein
MAQVSWMQYSTTDYLNFWNIADRLSPGSKGDDVKLLQYLLYWFNVQSGNFAYTLGDVDGDWGPRTSAAVAALEQTGPNFIVPDAAMGIGAGPFVADGVVDVVPGLGYTSILGPYKLFALQTNYATLHNVDISDHNARGLCLMAMPDDGFCPDDLAYALNAAKESSNVPMPQSADP